MIFLLAILKDKVRARERQPVYLNIKFQAKGAVYTMANDLRKIPKGKLKLCKRGLKKL